MAGKPTELIVFGPYDIPHVKQAKGSSKQITKENEKEFWEQKDVKQIAQKQGCYVFALKAGKGFTPWYVGKATKNFKQEALTMHKRGIYNEVTFQGKKGKPVMFFVGKTDKLLKVPKAIVDDIETFLIQSAYYKNPELKNIKKAKDPSWSIKGVFRSGKGKAPACAKQFKVMLKL